MTPVTATDILVATLTIYGEARGSTQEDRVAIAHVILNRAKARRWWGRSTKPSIADHSLTAVCLRPEQFSCWNPQDPNCVRLSTLRDDYSRVVQDRSCRAALKAILDAVDDWVPDPTDGATHYLTTRLHLSPSAPAWSRDKKFIELGAHRFFTEVL